MSSCTWSLGGSRRLLVLGLISAAACTAGQIEGDDSAGPDAGMDDPDAGPCVATGPEVHGDGVDNDCDGIVDELRVCGDGSEPFTTIAEAVAAAPDGGGVEVCAGVYAERITISGKSLRINGAGADQTIVDAGGLGTAFAITGHELTLAGMTIRNGRTSGNGGAIRCESGGITLLASKVLASRAELGGGGLHSTSCDLHIDGSRFEGNEGVEHGGGVYAVQSTGAIVSSQLVGNAADRGGAVSLVEGDVDIRASQLDGNTARVRGGALYQASDSAVEDSTMIGNHSVWIGGAVYVNQHAPTFRRTTFADNDADWEGGAFYLHQSAAVIEDSTITGNTSFDDGGALRIFECNATLARNLIANNHAIDGDGGAIKSSHLPSTYLDNHILDNVALGAGGGIELDNDASVLRGGVIAGNRSSIGGGVHVMLWPWNGGVIENVRIADNDAWRGGGIYLENNFVPVFIRGVTVEGNEANQGAGVYTRGTPLRLSNSLIIANEADDVGGAFFAHPSSAYPWTRPCPCPPIDPPATIDFVTAHGNIGEAGGAAAWIGAPNLTFADSVFSGHTTTAVVVDPLAIPSPAPAWRYNNTFPATFSGMSDPTGRHGNLATDPAFVAPGDFHFAPASACVDAADPGMTDPDGTRADMGLHGGPGAI